MSGLIENYDVADLLAAVGGLLLIPENMERELRLEWLARVAASRRSLQGKRRLSLQNLRKLCNSAPVGDFAPLEDPAENPFTECITFFGGSHVVLPGITDDATYIVSQLCRAIFIAGDDFSRSEFAQRAYRLLAAALLLSDTVASRAGLSRGEAPARAAGGKVFVPMAPRMAELKQAVTFTLGDLSRLLRSSGIDPSALAPLVLECGDVRSDELDQPTSQINIQPIVHVAEQFVVAQPTSILFAVRHHVIRLAVDLGVHEELAERYCDAVWTDVQRSLTFLDNESAPVRVPGGPGLSCFRHGFFNLDRDKLIYAALVSDDLRDYTDEPLGRWDSQGIPKKLEQTARQAEQDAIALGVPINEFLILFVIQAAGRFFAAGFERPAEPLRSAKLVVSAADLKVIAELEGGNQLVLWKFAHAGGSIRQTTRIAAFSQLDEFYLYRARRYSYQVSDDAIPDVLSIAPGSGNELRLDAQRKRDWHAVLSFEEGRLAEVTSLHDDPRVPLYVSPDHFRRGVALYVAGFSIPVWVIADESQRDTPAAREMQTILCEMVSYWLWQFREDIRATIEEIAALSRLLVLKLTLTGLEDWNSSTELATRDALDVDKEVVCRTGQTLGQIDILLGPGTKALLSGPDNDGERQFMRRTLRALASLVRTVNPAARDLLGETTIDQIINKCAPLGPKKMVIVSDLRFDPTLDDGDLPARRLIQEADLSVLRNEIGAALMTDGISFGRLHQPGAVANRIVAVLYKKLQELVRSVRKDELLEYTIATNEAVVRSSASHNLTVATRSACYGEFYDIVEQVMKEQAELNAAALSSRFLVEYVAARPNDGTRPVSLSVLDRLQALADQIINWGFVSDLVHLRIATVRLELTQSGRVTVNMKTYEEGRSGYLREAYFPSHVNEVIAAFERRWRRPQPLSEPPAAAADLESATADEFGLSLSQLLAFLTEVRGIGQSLQGPTKVMAEDDLLSGLQAALGWMEDDVRRGLDLFVLKPRPNFLSPPAPYRREDAYPWRFNRELSYVRRPLVWRPGTDAPVVIWGNRHVHMAAQNLVSLCLYGRLKPQSSRMKAYNSETLRSAGRDFNNRVADLLKEQPDFTVRCRVNKIGGQRIGGAAASLGDIDVLAADGRSGEILVIECKDLALARTPRELVNELESLFIGREGKESTAERQVRRANWLAGHLEAVIASLGLEASGPWKVRPLIIVDDEPLSSWIRKSPVPAKSLETLRGELDKRLALPNCVCQQ